MTSGRALSARADPEQGVRRGQQVVIAQLLRHRQSGGARRTYVLDTSVLLADPGAAKRFAEHEVVLPVVVITELEGKRHHPELGYFARSALRMLDDLRVAHGRLDEPIAVEHEGGTIRVELNHTDAASLPSGFRLGDNDTRILAVARNLADEGHRVTLVSKDLPLRIKASAVGLDAEEYRAEAISSSDTGYTGMAELEVAAADLDELYEDGVIDLADARDLPCHNGLVLLSDRGYGAGPGRCGQAACTSCAATATPSASTAVPPSSGSPWRCCSTPRSASSPSAAAPAPASPRWPCAPGSRP